MITNFEADVLSHAYTNGRYVTDDLSVIEMADRGLLRDYGPQLLAAGMHYLTTTSAGRSALVEWRRAQPRPPKVKKKRRSPQFQAWMDYQDANGRFPFPEFIKKVWPDHKSHYERTPAPSGVGPA